MAGLLPDTKGGVVDGRNGPVGRVVSGPGRASGVRPGDPNGACATGDRVRRMLP